MRILYTAHDSQLVCPNHLMQNPITGQRCTKCMEKNAWCCVQGKCIHGSTVQSILAAFEHTLYRNLKTYRRIDQIICPSQFMQERLATDSVLKPRLILLRNFADMETSDGSQKKDYVFYFGRYSEEKGIRTLLKVCRNLPEIPFVFAGSGDLENLVNAAPNVENVGFLSGEALSRKIAEARFTIFPSECYENCPFSVMESVLNATPVIGTNAGGVPELIEEGKTGELFQAGDDEELTQKVKALWQDRKRCEKYAENCKTVHFDTLEEYCEKLCGLYKGE